MAKRTTKKGLLSQKKKQTNKLYTRPSHFLYVSCPFLHDYEVKMPKFEFYGQRKQATMKFLFLSLNLDMVPWSSTSGGFAYICQSKWVGIITIKTERAKMHF